MWKTLLPEQHQQNSAHGTASSRFTPLCNGRRLSPEQPGLAFTASKNPTLKKPTPSALHLCRELHLLQLTASRRQKSQSPKAQNPSEVTRWGPLGGLFCPSSQDEPCSPGTAAAAHPERLTGQHPGGAPKHRPSGATTRDDTSPRCKAHTPAAPRRPSPHGQPLPRGSCPHGQALPEGRPQPTGPAPPQSAQSLPQPDGH